MNENKYNKLAVAGFVLTILADLLILPVLNFSGNFLLSYPAIILGLIGIILAMSSFSKTKEYGKGKALAVIAMVLFLLLFLSIMFIYFGAFILP